MTANAELVVVDDDDLLRAVLAGNLAQAGYRVRQFADPQSALAGFEGPADLLILDRKMP